MALSSSSPNMYDETQLQYPEWQGPLHDALLELDMDRLQDRVAVAKAAVINRLQAVSQSPNHHAERRAIEDALNTLRVLEQEQPGVKQNKRP